VFLSVFTLIETICSRICSNSRPRSAKGSLPVDVRPSKTSLLKLPNMLRLRIHGTGRIIFDRLKIHAFRCSVHKEPPPPSRPNFSVNSEKILNGLV